MTARSQHAEVASQRPVALEDEGAPLAAGRIFSPRTIPPVIEGQSGLVTVTGDLGAKSGPNLGSVRAVNSESRHSFRSLLLHQGQTSLIHQDVCFLLLHRGQHCEPVKALFLTEPQNPSVCPEFPADPKK